MNAAVDTNGARSARGTPAPRHLPHNLSSEKSVLGGILVDNSRLQLLPELEPGDFYDHRNRVVFEAMRNLEVLGKPIDPTTLEFELEKLGKIEAITIAYIGEIAMHVPTVENTRTYANDVRQLHRHRRAILTLGAALERAYNWQHDPADLVSEIASDLQRIDIGSDRPSKNGALITIPEAVAEMAELSTAPVYSTPFPTLNDAIGMGGMLGTQVYTVAAGTGRGKTTWVASVAAHVAEQDIPVIVASYEMKPYYFVARRAAGLLSVHSNRILRQDGVSMGAVMATMPYTNFFLMHRPTLRDLRIRVDQVAQRFGRAPLLVVDYLQKLADAIAAKQQRMDLRLATTEASATLLEIAESSRSAIIAVSAIGRGKGKQMASPRKFEPYELVEVAKESGAVEYDGAGLIVLTLSGERDGDERVATMTLAKARFGTEVHIDARYHGARGTWRDMGAVDVMDSVVTPPPPEPSNAEVEQILIQSLHAAPARTQTDVVERCRGAKKTALREAFKGLLSRGVIAKIGTGFALSEVGRQLVITEAQ